MAPGFVTSIVVRQMIQQTSRKHKVAFVSGGSKGIGFAIVNAFVRENYFVVTCGRNAATWMENVSADSGLSASVDFQQCDLSDQSALDGLFSYIAMTYAYLDVAVNNASPAIRSSGQFSQVFPEALFDTLINDLWVPAQCMRHELNMMQGPGAIINIGSVNGSRPVPGAAMYGAAKHGLEGLTKSVALEAVTRKIRVNTVAPGVTWTPRWEARINAGQARRNDVEQMIPMKRFAQASEIAEAVVWLASDHAAYVVGHTLVVDGGLSLT